MQGNACLGRRVPLDLSDLLYDIEGLVGLVGSRVDYEIEFIFDWSDRLDVVNLSQSADNACYSFLDVAKTQLVCSDFGISSN